MFAKLFGLGGCLTILICNILLGGVCVQYTLEYWLTFIKHAHVALPFLPCALAGLFFGEVAVPAAILTWLISFAI